jgi:hypothetical protein
MTHSVFLTGDRQLPPEVSKVLAASSIAQLALAASNDETTLEIYTGDNVGFEAGVRAIGEALALPVNVIVTKLDAQTGKPDWDERHNRVGQLVEKVVIVHPSPLDSSIGASAMKVLGDKVQLAAI